MQLFVEKVFDGFVLGHDFLDLVWTDARFQDLLGTADTLTVEAYVDRVTGVNPTIYVVSAHSNDGANWAFVGVDIELALTPGQSAFAIGTTQNHLGAYAGYAIALVDDPGSTPSAHVTLRVLGRGDCPVDVHFPLSPGA